MKQHVKDCEAKRDAKNKQSNPASFSNAADEDSRQEMVTQKTPV